MHRDNQGIIVQADGDDGDSLHREGLMLLAYRGSGLWYRLYKDGKLRRGTTKWTDPNNVSRDQLVPVLAWSALENEWYFRVVLSHFNGWLLRTPNGDVGLTHISMFLRGHMTIERQSFGGLLVVLKEALTLMTLHFTDLFFLGGAIVKTLPVRYNDQQKRLEWNDMDKVDDWNDVVPLLHAARSYPTLTSWLARTIYRTFRKKNHGRDLTTSYDRVYQALLWYNRSSSGGNPELVEIYKKDLEKYFSTPSLIRKARQLMGRYGCYQK